MRVAVAQTPVPAALAGIVATNGNAPAKVIETTAPPTTSARRQRAGDPGPRAGDPGPWTTPTLCRTRKPDRRLTPDTAHVATATGRQTARASMASRANESGNGMPEGAWAPYSSVSSGAAMPRTTAAPMADAARETPACCRSLRSETPRPKPHIEATTTARTIGSTKDPLRNASSIEGISGSRCSASRRWMMPSQRAPAYVNATAVMTCLARAPRIGCAGDPFMMWLVGIAQPPQSLALAGGTTVGHRPWENLAVIPELLVCQERERELDALASAQQVLRPRRMRAWSSTIRTRITESPLHCPAPAPDAAPVPPGAAFSRALTVLGEQAQCPGREPLLRSGCRRES